MKKNFRQGQIFNLIRSQPIHTQEELSLALKKLGIDVTQVTLSRDMREIGLVKTPQGYREAQEAAVAGEGNTGALKRAVEEFVRDVQTAQNIVIIRTDPGSASPLAEALDNGDWPEIVGTLAGDNTVFVVAPDSKQALKAKERLLALLR